MTARPQWRLCLLWGSVYAIFRHVGRDWVGRPLPSPMEHDIEDYDIDTELVDRATGGKLPALNVNLSFDLDVGPAGEPEIDVLIREFQLQHVATLPDDDE